MYSLTVGYYDYNHDYEHYSSNNDKNGVNHNYFTTQLVTNNKYFFLNMFYLNQFRIRIGKKDSLIA